MIASIPDLTICAAKLLASPKYRASVWAQLQQIKDFVDKNGYAGTRGIVGDILSKEWDKIAALPPEQQAEAIGKFAGNVIAALTAIRGLMYVAQMTGKAAIATQ